MAARPRTSTIRSMTTEPLYASEKGEGWISFSGVMIFVLGIINVIWGIAAISKSAFFVGDTKLIFDNIKTWGWIMLLVGLVQFLVGLGVFSRNQGARWAGVGIASLNLIAAMSSISAYPFWALV